MKESLYLEFRCYQKSFGGDQPFVAAHHIFGVLENALFKRAENLRKSLRLRKGSRSGLLKTKFIASNCIPLFFENKKPPRWLNAVPFIY